MIKKTIRIAITGATGNIGYSLIFRIAKGEMTGEKQNIILQLLGRENDIEKLKALMMELHDCDYPLLKDIVIETDINKVFQNADIALLIGAKPRTNGMTRSDLLKQNALIFKEQGKALNEFANKKIKVLIVGNPVNTNALIVIKNAPNLKEEQITALTRLDHNRAIFQLAKKMEINVSEIKNLIIWGNHSISQCPDLTNATCNGEKCKIDKNWYENEFIPKIQERGNDVIKLRGLSSAASASEAIISHMKDWIFGTRENDFVSMGVYSNGEYGIEKDIVFSFPVECKNGKYKIIKNLKIDDFVRNKMKDSEKELLNEKIKISHLLK
jgi:malate dehydrogenase